MSDVAASSGTTDQQALQAEIIRLNKIIKVLMDRAERSTNVHGSDFSLFQTTIMLKEQVRRRTEALEAALHQNEVINHALRESEAKFRGVVSQSLVGIAIVENKKISYANPTFAKMFGYNVDEILHLTPLDLTAESDRQFVADQIQKRVSGQVDRVSYVAHGIRKDGSLIDIECHSSVMKWEEKLALISLILDITERTQAEREVRELQHRLREQAIHDPLTGLYNRLSLNEIFDRELGLAASHGLPVSIIMADLDQFKDVNDTYGHLAGDEVLRVFGELVKRSYRQKDICCRYGGDEFLLVLPDMSNEVACERTEHLRAVLEETSVVFGSTVIHVTASFGVATFPEHGTTSDALSIAADKALYVAKKEGRNHVGSYSDVLES
jgi:diguanylate cyclase (GGDEF)-like protein/PAS domain S-box-containing protein